MPVHITTHGGKMKNIQSISTSSTHNPFCQKMAKCADNICSKCFSNRYEGLRPTMVKALQRNASLLSERVLSEDELPVLNAQIFRFQAFGDLLNVNHAINLLNIAKKNPGTFFGIWTKRANVMQMAINKVGRTDNMNLIYSAPKIGVEPKVPKYFDKTFTVHPKGSSAGINCGAKNCDGCRICYTKNDVVSINETLK